MATDNTLLSAPVGTGVTVRTFADGGGIEWPASVTSYVTGGSAGAWTLAQVDITHGLPVQPMTGATFAVSAASLPLPTGASTAAKQPALGTAGSASVDVITVQGVASMTPLLVTATISSAQTIAVTNAGTFAVQATQSGTWTVGTSAAQTIAVTNTGTFATQAAQSGTWNITNVSGTVSLPTGASTAAKQPALGTAGSASSDVITVQGVASMTPLLVTASIAAAQTMAVTNAGTFAVQVSSALPAGTNVIGHVIVDSGVITTVSTVTAVTAITNPLPAGTNLMGKVGIDQTTPGTTNAVQQVAGTTGGYSTSSFLSTAAVQSTAVKGSAGQVYRITFTNINATPVYLRLYDKATAPLTSDTPVWRVAVPGNAAGAGYTENFPAGMKFTTGIGFRCTGAIADSDATSLAANTVLGNIAYD